MGQRPEQMNYKLLDVRRRECEEVCQHLGLSFKRSPALLDIALTHEEYLSSHPEARSYRQLAFIGSIVLSVLHGKRYIESNGLINTGEEDRRSRHLLERVHRDALPSMFVILGLGKHLRVRTSSNREVKSVQQDALKAVIAVSFLWEGMIGAESFWDRWCANAERDMSTKSENEEGTDSLQRWLQARGLTLPIYKDSRNLRTPDHDASFNSACYVGGEKMGEGEGKSKKKARKAASLQALQRLEQGDNHQVRKPS